MALRRYGVKAFRYLLPPVGPAKGPPRRYTKLDGAPVLATTERLAARVKRRFPESGLARVAEELALLAKENAAVIARLRQPIWWLRSVTILAIVSLLGTVLWLALSLLPPLQEGGLAPVLAKVSSSDAFLNVLIFLAIAILFLVSLETRFKRRAALGTLHQLRSIAHVIDMHQLTKDPENVLRPTPGSDARAAADSSLTHHGLVRYLGYCGEMLSLVSKLAALHAQDLQDPVVLTAVNEIEELTSDLARSVWQKITILDVAVASHP